jgi:vacuolar-type H+-ATPase subunit H
MEGRVPSEGRSGGNIDELIGSTTERVQTVLEAAERAAEGIIKDAEAEAERQIAESRQRAEELLRERSGLATKLSDELLERAAAIRAQSDQLIVALQRATEMLEGELAATPESGPEAPAAAAAEPAAANDSGSAPDTSAAEAPPRRAGLTAVPSPESGRRGPDPSDSGVGGEGAPRDPAKAARLLATQMAVAGSSREEIESRLRDELGIDDPGSILDAVSGGGGIEPGGRA